MARVLIISVPVFLALLLAALLHRPVVLLRRLVPASVAAIAVLVGALVLVSAVVWLVYLRTSSQAPVFAAESQHVIDGDRQWTWLVRLLPLSARPVVNGAGHRAFAVLSGWIGGTVVIAVIHAVVIGLTVWLLGDPLAVVLALLVFFGSFIPLVGAVVFGGIAVLVVLLAVGRATGRPSSCSPSSWWRASWRHTSTSR